MRNPFRYFNSSPEVIRLAVIMYIRYPLSLRQVEDLLFEREGLSACPLLLMANSGSGCAMAWDKGADSFHTFWLGFLCRSQVSIRVKGCRRPAGHSGCHARLWQASDKP